MSKFNVRSLANGIRKTVFKHSPEILTGLGIAGMISTVVMAVKVTPKAEHLLKEKKDDLEKDELTVVETVKTTWKCYIPAAVTGVSSIACLIGSCSVNHKRNAALATAYSLSETALREYGEKVLETVGEKKESAVRDAIAKDKIAKNPVVSKEVIVTAKGNTLCMDAMTGRYFKSDMDTIRRAETDLNAQMIDDMYISLNEYFYAIGLPETTLGDELGWNIYTGKIDLCFSSQIAEDGNPCLVIDHRIPPKYGYREY